MQQPDKPAELKAMAWDCDGDTLIGVLSVPPAPAKRGVLIVVGGPQYRIGSHRQFVAISNAVADQGMASLRFDYRGMGDSEGTSRGFDDTASDVASAIDHFCAHVPTLQEVVLLGLCDGATAATLYACHDPRVAGLALLNPWVRTDAGQAKTILKHYYAGRLLERSFWKKVLQGKFDYRATLSSLVHQVRTAADKPTKAQDFHPSLQSSMNVSSLALPARFLQCLLRFRGKILIILSGKDLTALEFTDQCRTTPEWRKLENGLRMETAHLANADHTFSTRASQDALLATLCRWITSW